MPGSPFLARQHRRWCATLLQLVMTAAATGHGCRCRQQGDRHPQPVPAVFVVPVIIAGRQPRPGSVTLFGKSTRRSRLQFFHYRASLLTGRVDDPANIWAIGLLLVVGLIVSGVAFTSCQRAAEAAPLRRQTTVLQGYSHDVVAADNTNAIVSITSRPLAALFQVPVVVMLVTEGRVVSLEQVGDVVPPGSRSRGGAIVPGDGSCRAQRRLPESGLPAL